MPDASAYRAKWGVIIPSTNTSVEYDYARLLPHGVSFHAGRAFITRPEMGNDENAKALLDQMDERFDEAVAHVMTVKPDRLVIAMSAEVIRRGVAGGAAFVNELAERTGLPVTSAPDAVIAALREIGATRIGLITPYHPESDALTIAYLREHGIDVLANVGFRCASATDIAMVPAPRVIEALREVNVAGVEALVQMGTNLAMLELTEAAERWLGVPTIAMNTATVWKGLRDSGMTDTIAGYGSLMRDH